MISCSEAVRQLWAYLEDEVPTADRAQIQAHLDVCRRCCGEVEFADELRRFLARHAEGDAVIPDNVEQRLHGFLDRLDTSRTI